MTYLQFHFVFTIPAILLLWALQRRPMAGVGAGPAWRAIGFVVVIAFVYTTPWDNYLVYREVWGYGPNRVIGTIGYVPIEEYMFFVLQTVLTGLWLCLVRWWLPPDDAVPPPRGWKAGGIALWLGLTALGVAFLFGTRSLYMGLILAWAAPVLAGMHVIGAAEFWRERRAWALGIAVPTLYLWAADTYAIANGIWYIEEAVSFPLRPFGLPIEEATFFWITNVLVVQGVLLFLPQRHHRLEPMGETAASRRATL